MCRWFYLVFGGGFWWLGGGWVCGLMVANIVGLFLIVNGFVKKNDWGCGVGVRG